VIIGPPDSGTKNKGTENKGTENKGTENKGTKNKGHGNQLVKLKSLAWYHGIQIPVVAFCTDGCVRIWQPRAAGCGAVEGLL
jgi:hypothetical protein